MLSLINSAPAFDFSAIARADLQPSTKVKYTRAIQALLLAAINPFDFEALTAYAATLPTSSRAFLKSALRIITEAELNRIKASATPENINHIQALIMRIDALDSTITVSTPKGTKAHTWLSGEQVEQITALPDRSTLSGRRDYIVLCVLLASGIRRDELVHLTFDCLKQQPSKSGMRYVLDITGKGNKSRVIPISKHLANALLEWKTETNGGFVARSVNGRMGDSLSEIGIHNIIRRYGALIGIPKLSTHDTRRTYARLGYDAGVPLEQISKLLGHEDVKTTMRYLGIEIDLNSSISDFIPLS